MLFDYQSGSSFFVAVMVVDADERSSEGEYLAEGDEYGVVYLADRWAEEARYEQCAPEGAHCGSDDELHAFHQPWYASHSCRKM